MLRNLIPAGAIVGRCLAIYANSLNVHATFRVNVGAND
jgi:hypothetical protein